MEEIFANLVTLGMLTLLQAVLGFDNLLYLLLEAKRAPAEKQAMVRRLGIGIAVALRIILLFALIKLVGYFQNPFLYPRINGVLEAEFNLHSIIVLVGGVFIIYTATKEILHMMSLEKEEHEKRGQKSLASRAQFRL